MIGRGVCKKLKEMFPDIELLPLDYDPDVSRANIENRLQMMIMNGHNAAVTKKRAVSEQADTEEGVREESL